MLNDYIFQELNLGRIEDSPLKPVIDDYINFLSDHGYRHSTIKAYLHGVAHFAYWLKKTKFGWIYSIKK